MSAVQDTNAPMSRDHDRESPPSACRELQSLATPSPRLLHLGAAAAIASSSLLIASPANAQSAITLAWDYPGTAAGFVLSQGKTPGRYDTTIEIPYGSARSIRLLNIGATNYYSLRAYGPELVLSDYCPELRVVEMPAGEGGTSAYANAGSATLTVDMGDTRRAVSLSMSVNSSTGQPELTACGIPGQRFLWQSSYNLHDWQTIGGGSISLGGIATKTDTRPGANQKNGPSGCAFYRALVCGGEVSGDRTIDVAAAAPVTLSMHIRADGTPCISASGRVGGKFCVETTTDLGATWNYACMGEIAGDGHWQVSCASLQRGSEPRAETTRFYRAISIPPLVGL